MTFRLFNPPVFQGNLKKKNYFEGWYFKHVSADTKHVISFIPGISLNDKDSHAFVQVINDAGESAYFSYPLSLFSWSKNELYIKVGNSVFTDSYLSIDAGNGITSYTGRIGYHNITRYPVKIFSPGIMGWYSFVPYMECKHGIVSANHDLSGGILVNGVKVNFDRGKGYIEKDWGTSFPESWLWVQANNFNDHHTSLYFSVAKIPWMGKFFIGFIAFLYYKSKYYLFSSYNNSRITGLKSSGDSISIAIENKHFSLKINSAGKIAGELRAPVMGSMSRKIRESIDAGVSVALYDSEKKAIYTDHSNSAGIELIEKILEYFNDGKELQTDRKSYSATPVQNGR